MLFAGSVAENIRLGRLDASEDDVVAAAKMANAHNFILKIPGVSSSVCDFALFLFLLKIARLHAKRTSKTNGPRTEMSDDFMRHRTSG